MFLLLYLTQNYVPLLILSALIIIMFINKKNYIPASNLFFLGVTLLLVITVLDTIEHVCHYQDPSLPMTLDSYIRVRTIVAAIIYIIRPFIIMIEVLIIIPSSVKLRALCAIPAAVNMVIYSTAFTGSHLAFYYNDENWFCRGPLYMSIFISQTFYVALLLGISIRYFNASSKGKNAVCILIICQAVLTSVLEYKNILPETSNTVTALAILEYYVYLNLIYQQNLRETIIQRELDVQKEKLLMLRNQIHPHFIYNSLSIIRALAKRDSVRAVNSIDIFSAYLRNHISAIESDELVPFEKELSNVGVYIDLVRADKTKKIIVEYDLKTKDFEIPPLSLEPIVENAVNYGISRDGGKITIGSDEDEQSYFVIIKDDGSGASSPKNEETVHTGIGLENTRKRLAMLCDGSLEIVLGDKGAAVTVTIPKKTDSKEDNTNESAYS